MLFALASPIKAQDKADAQKLKSQKVHQCAKRKPIRTQIIYNVNIKPTRYIYTHTEKMLTDMSSVSNDWYEKNKQHAWVSRTQEADWHTQGLTKGSVSMSTNANYIAKPYDRYGMYYCPYIKQLNVDINYGSEIYVARKYKKGTCKFKEIYDHELRHHDTNVTIVEMLAKRMEADTPEIIAFMEGRYIPKEKVDTSFEKLSEGIKDALTIYLDEIMSKKDEFNALIDTPEEYKRLSEVCR